MERCSVFLRDHVSVKTTSLIYLFRAAVPSLDQHIFAFASAALSACSKHPSLSYDHASIMSRDPNPVEHTLFPWQGGGRGGSTRGRGVKYSTAWSDLAQLQRVMKQLHRSVVYVPISLPNEWMSRTQVKNELAQCSSLRGKSEIPFPSKTPHIPSLYCSPPPVPNLDFSGNDWLNWKQPAPQLQSSPLLHP